MNAPNNLVYEFGPFLLEPHARRLSRHGQSVPLGAPEFELLLLLVRNHGRVVEKREIMEAVWPDVEVEENNLTVRMSALRKALGETKGNRNHQYILTVGGVPAWSPDGKVIALSILMNESGGRTYMKVIGLGVTDHTESTLIPAWGYIGDET